MRAEIEAREGAGKVAGGYLSDLVSLLLHSN